MSHADAANKTVQELVRVHRNEVFPAIFKQLTFDMVAEIEFDINKEGKKFYVTSSRQRHVAPSSVVVSSRSRTFASMLMVRR